MGAIKLDSYTDLDLGLSLYGKVVAHPARLVIARMLLEGRPIRNIDLMEELNLTKGAVKNHVSKFAEANLIELHYLTHFYLILLRPEYREVLGGLMEVLDGFAEKEEASRKNSDTNL